MLYPGLLRILLTGLVGRLLRASDDSNLCNPGAPGCVESGKYYWPQQKGDLNRTGFSAYVVPDKLETGPTWRWVDPHDDVIRNAPLIDDKLNIYLSTQGGRVWKFSKDGEVLWTYKSPRGNIPVVPSIGDGRLYLNSWKGYVWAIDMETGEELWVTKVSNLIARDTGCMFFNHGVVVTNVHYSNPYQKERNNVVLALNASTGEKLWDYQFIWATFNFQASSPGDGTLLYQDAAGGLTRLNLTDGSLIWESGVQQRQLHDFTTGAAVVGPNGLVYVASNWNGWGMIHTYHLKDGSLAWLKNVTLQANQAVAVGRLPGSDRLAVVAGVGQNPSVPMWMRLPSWLPDDIKSFINQKSDEMKGLPTWLWGTKQLVSSLIALDAETGEKRWTYEPPPFYRSSCAGDEALLMRRIQQSQANEDMDTVCYPDNWSQAVIGGDGTVYAGFMDGRLYAVNDKDGNGVIDSDGEVSTYDFGQGFQGSQAIAPGMLAVAPCGGGLSVWRS